MPKLTINVQVDTKCFMEEHTLRTTQYTEPGSGLESPQVENSWRLEEYRIYAGKYHIRPSCSEQLTYGHPLSSCSL